LAGRAMVKSFLHVVLPRDVAPRLGSVSASPRFLYFPLARSDLNLGVHPVITPLLRFEWHSRLDPGIESAVKRMHIFPATLGKLLRHTGARSFVRSSAISYHCAIFGYLFEVFVKFSSRHSKRVR